jgi:hypothetical protein
MNMTEAVTIPAITKNLAYVAVFFATVEWLGYNPEAMGALLVLMLVDIITGTTRAVTLNGGQAFTSALLKKGIFAKALLISVLFSLGIASKGMGLGVEVFGQGIVSVLMLGELYSIIGNVHSIKTGETKVEFDAIKFLLDKVKKTLDRFLQ